MKYPTVGFEQCKLTEWNQQVMENAMTLSTKEW